MGTANARMRMEKTEYTGRKRSKEGNDKAANKSV